MGPSNHAGLVTGEVQCSKSAAVYATAKADVGMICFEGGGSCHEPRIVF